MFIEPYQMPAAKLARLPRIADEKSWVGSFEIQLHSYHSPMYLIPVVT